MGIFKEGFPLLSIVTVSYNEVNTIEQTINSVLEQDYENFEYIIIDGGSSDGTIEIIESYSDRLAYWVSERDRNLYHAINKGLAKCQGDIIGIIHANDFYLKGTFKRIVDIFFQEDVDALYSDCLMIREDGTQFLSKVKDRTLHDNMIHHSTFFVTSAVYNKIGNYDLKYQISSDYDFALRLYFSQEFNLKYAKGDCFAAHRLGGRESIQFWVNRKPTMWLRVLIDYNSIKYKYGLLGIIGYAFNILRDISYFILYKIGFK